MNQQLAAQTNREYLHDLGEDGKQKDNLVLDFFRRKHERNIALNVLAKERDFESSKLK